MNVWHGFKLWSSKETFKNLIHTETGNIVWWRETYELKACIKLICNLIVKFSRSMTQACMSTTPAQCASSDHSTAPVMHVETKIWLYLLSVFQCKIDIVFWCQKEHLDILTYNIFLHFFKSSLKAIIQITSLHIYLKNILRSVLTFHHMYMVTRYFCTCPLSITTSLNAYNISSKKFVEFSC